MSLRAQEMCESRGGRPGLPVPDSPYGLCGRKATLALKREKERLLSTTTTAAAATATTTTTYRPYYYQY